MYHSAMNLMLMCYMPKQCRNILLHYYSSADNSVDRTRVNRPLTFQSHARSKVTSLNRQIKIRMRHVTRDPSSNRQLYQCNDCNGRFTTLQSLPGK